MTEQTPKKNNKVILLVVLLAVSIIGNIFQALQTKGNTETITEQKTLYDTLVLEHQGTVELYEESMALVESLKADSIQMNSEIEGKVSEIQQLQQEIQDLKKNSKNKAKLAEDLNKKFKQMKKLNDDLQKDIEKLLLENKALYDKNVALKGNVDSLTGVTADLGKKVNTGALTVIDFWFVTILEAAVLSIRLREFTCVAIKLIPRLPQTRESSLVIVKQLDLYGPHLNYTD